MKKTYIRDLLILIAMVLAVAVSFGPRSSAEEVSADSSYTLVFRYIDMTYYEVVQGGEVSVNIKSFKRAFGLDTAPITSFSVDDPDIFSVEYKSDEPSVLKVKGPFEGQQLIHMGVNKVVYDILVSCEQLPVKYIDKSGKEQALTIYADVTQKMGDGWYIVSGYKSFDGRMEINGDVKIVLLDGSSLNAKKGITVADKSGVSLTIYGQKEQTGKLTATGAEYQAGIGGTSGMSSGPITIAGGKIYAKGGTWAAGIGGGKSGSQKGTITILGDDDGKWPFVESYGFTFYGSGIGGGNGGNGGTVNISGGTVETKGGSGGAGIGGGNGGRNGKITISGGTVSAQSDKAEGKYSSPSCGAGIGSGGDKPQGDEIKITGGFVSAACWGYGAGIGGGAENNDGCDGGTVTITGGDVTAMSIFGAGIGGGGGGGMIDGGVGGGDGGDGGTVTITGGTVTAISFKSGAGIGGGNDGDGGTVKISGGYVTALGGYYEFSWIKENGAMSGKGRGYTTDKYNKYVQLYVYEAIADEVLDWIFSGTYAGAGIGGGDDGDGGNVTITGGEVVCLSGRDTAHGIGRGDGGKKDGTLELGARICALPARDWASAMAVPKDEAISKSLEKPYVKTKICDHVQLGTSYDVSVEGHTVHCNYCNSDKLGWLAHEFDSTDRKCKVCKYERVFASFNSGGGTGSMAKKEIRKGTEYALPDCGFTAPKGKNFLGWKLNGGDDILPAGEKITADADLDLTAQWTGTYDIWIGSVRVTDDNKADILGNGKLSFDPSKNTLLLNGLDGIPDNYNGAVIYAKGIDLTIKGQGSIYLTKGMSSNAINCEDGTLTIEGDISVKNSLVHAIHCNRDVYINGGDVSVSAQMRGISTTGKLIIGNGIKELRSESKIALYADKGIVLDEGVHIETPDGGKIAANKVTIVDKEDNDATVAVLRGGISESTGRCLINKDTWHIWLIALILVAAASCTAFLRIRKKKASGKSDKSAPDTEEEKKPSED